MFSLFLADKWLTEDELITLVWIDAIEMNTISFLFHYSFTLYKGGKVTWSLGNKPSIQDPSIFLCKILGRSWWLGTELSSQTHT